MYTSFYFRYLFRLFLIPKNFMSCNHNESLQVVDKLYILKIYKTNLKKVVERFLLLGDFW